MVRIGHGEWVFSETKEREIAAMGNKKIKSQKKGGAVTTEMETVGAEVIESCGDYFTKEVVASKVYTAMRSELRRTR